MSKFTKGPWFYVESMTAEECGLPGGKAADVLVEDDDMSENRTVMGISILDDLTDDDARLISAAPELLSALEDCAEVLDPGDTARDETYTPGSFVTIRLQEDEYKAIVTAARAALAKADGKAQP